MTNILEATSANIDAFKGTEVAKAEPLQDSLIMAEQDPKLIFHKFYQYYSVIRDLFDLSQRK